MKNKKAILSILALSTLAASVAFVASCGSSQSLPSGGNLEAAKSSEVNDLGKPIIPSENKNGTNLENNSNNAPELDKAVTIPDFRKNSELLITAEQKINYVSIGDSISAGFDGTLDADYKGKIDADGTISGLSYASFLARALNVDNRVESFNNYAISGTTLLDWITVLNANSPEQRTVSIEHLKSIFGNDYEKVLKEINANLRKANLITLNLGANDFLEQFIKSLKDNNIFDELSKMTNKDFAIGPIITKTKGILDDTIKVMTARMVEFSRQLKLIAPKANINIVSYPMPFIKMKNLIDQLTASIDSQLNFSLSEFLLAQINDTIKTVAQRSEINYIQAYNPTYWAKNSDKLSSIYFDIHPNTFGYKKMALDIYLKITNNFLKVNEFNKLGDFDFDAKYIEKDALSVNYQVEVKNYQETIKKVFGTSTQNFLDTESDSEKLIKPIRSSSNFGKRIEKLAGTYRGMANNFFDFVMTSDFYKELDPNSVLKNFLYKNDKAALNEFISWFLGSEYLQNVFKEAQAKLEELAKNNPENKITSKDLQSAFMGAVFSNDSLFKLLKSFVTSNFIKNHGQDFAKTINLLLLGPAGDKIYQLIIDKIPSILKAGINQASLDENKIKEAITKVVPKQKVFNLVTLFLENIAKNQDKFKNAQNLDQLVNTLLSLPEIKTNVTKFVKDIISNPELKTLLVPIIKKIITSNDLNWLVKDVKNLDKLLNNAYDLIILVDKQTDLSTELVSSLFSNISTKGIDPKNWDLITGVKNSFLKKWAGSFEKNIVQIIKEASKSKLFSESKDDLKIIFKNLLNHVKNDNFLATFILKALPESQKSQIFEYFESEEMFKKVISKIVNNDNFNGIIDEFIAKVLDSTQDFNNVSTFNDILKVILTKIDFDKVKNNTKNLVTTFIKDEDVKRVFKNFLVHTLAKYGFDKSNPDNNNFINDFVKDLDKLYKYFELDKHVIDVLFEQIKLAQKSDDPIKILKNIPSEILSSLSKEINANPLEFIKKIFKYDTFNKNKKGFANLIKSVYKTISHNLDYNALFKQATNWNPEIAKWIDNEELASFVTKITNNQDFNNIVNKTIDLLVLDQAWLDKAKNINDVLNHVFASEQFKNNIKNDFKNLVKLIIDSLPNSLDKTITKVLKNYLLTLNINVDENLKPELVSKIITSFYQSLQTNNSLEELSEKLANALIESKNINEFSTKSSQQLISVVSKNLVTFLRLLTNNLDKVQANNLKDIFSKLTTHFLSETNVENITSLLVPASLLNNYGISDSSKLKLESKTLFLKPEFKEKVNKLLENFFKNISQFKNQNSDIEFIGTLLKNEEFNTALKELSSLTFDELVQKESLVDTFNAVFKRFSKNQLSWLFKNINNSDVVIQTFSKDFFEALKTTQLHKKSIESIFNKLKTLNYKGKSFNDILAETAISILDNEESLVQFVEKILKSDTIKKNEKLLSKLFINLLDKFSTDDQLFNLVYSFIPANVSNELNTYVGKENIYKLVKEVLQNIKFREIIATSLDKISKNTSSLNNPKKFSDLINYVLENVDFKAQKEDIKSFIDGLLKSENTKDIIKNILNRYI
ncbi:SGNH/GDSL hydrolase family protein [Mycoplasmopsis alligatoris]|uniref:GDSL-like protein n=1 Tax=Mycoplasmopsis alligatoris A21JP2 TaxID=747682 RepID=D4XVR8_9BACT|nr:SGNH/GDSL hydrolase family protein [Mycoplasmopsis alligatoris]EFF41552.1 GDSL-like protein [Mycoplasmopsis alligatoris A21JP2]